MGPVDAALAQQNLVDEIRFGVYDHDTDLIGSKKESGADLIVEVLSRRIASLDFIGGPRFLIGGAINTAGRTNQIYIGLARSWELFEGVFNPGDAVYLEGTLGGSWNDGKLDVLGTPEEENWKSHGSRFLFRENIAIGYRFNAKWSVALNLNHISNAGLADPNEGMNDIGLTVNMKLGDR
jgi:lipid A 3-O-deacylase